MGRKFWATFADRPIQSTHILVTLFQRPNSPKRAVGAALEKRLQVTPPGADFKVYNLPWRDQIWPSLYIWTESRPTWQRPLTEQQRLRKP